MTAKQHTWEEKREEKRNVIIARSSASLSRSSKDRGLHYRKRALWIVGFYLPFLFVPWVLTCIMMYRPIMLPSYISQKGAYSMTQIWQHEKWLTAVKVLNRIAAVLGVPVVSAILAQGAVVYAQRRKENQSLSIRQLFSLADRGWVDPGVLWNALRYNLGPSTSTLYLWLGAFLVLLTAVQPPIQSIVVQEEVKLIVTCKDNPKRRNNDDKTCDRMGYENKVVGFDPEPPELEMTPQNYVVHRTLQNIISVSSNDIQTRMRRENFYIPEGLVDPQRLSFYWIYTANAEAKSDGENGRSDYYVSSMLNGTDTGVLREHAVRMDSKVQCQHEDSFPEECAGDHPFTYIYTSNMTEVQICTEGSINKYPFTRSRNKQEISERIWFDLRWTNPDLYRDLSNEGMKNYTMSCDARSRRGWFELANYQNEYEPSGMLEKWPSPEEMEENFNDYTSLSTDNDFYPIEEEKPSGDRSYSAFDLPVNAFSLDNYIVSGPLMMASLALFGNNTYFHTAANTTTENQLKAGKDVCQSGRIPFAVYGPDYSNGAEFLTHCSEYSIRRRELAEDAQDRDLMSYLVGGFMQKMEYLGDAQRILEITMFFANEALLSGTAELRHVSESRSIYSAPGYQVLKPQKTVAGIISISVLIALQVLGLLLLLRFIYSVPAWTGSFDADAMVQIGGQLREQDQEFNIAGASGLVGVVNRDVPRVEEEEASGESESLRNKDQGRLGNKERFESSELPIVPLALGAPGVITRRMHKQAQ